MNLGAIQKMIDAGKLDAKAAITRTRWTPPAWSAARTASACSARAS